MAHTSHTRPFRGTPEWDLWVAAIEVAIAAPMDHDASTTFAAKVPWSRIEALRAALDGVGIDWRTAKAMPGRRSAPLDDGDPR